MGEGQKAYKEQALYLMDSNSYMVLATVGEDGTPWSATVAFVRDRDCDLYFISAIDSRHAENLLKSPRVSFVIFDSRQSIGKSAGLQGVGEASVVPDKQVKKAVELYAKRLFPKSEMAPVQRYPPGHYSAPSEFRFFKVKISSIYLTGTEDRRTQVHLVDTED